jgi:hypothetical protein
MNAHRSVLAQVLQQWRHDEIILDTFSFALSNAKSDSNASNEDLLQLLSVIIRRKQNIYVILDGIDEGDNPDVLIKDLISVFHNSNGKLLFFSRPNVHTLRKAHSLRSITITRSSVEPDLRIYFSRQVELLCGDGLLPASHSCEELVAHLLSGANGMFMWARLMISYLNSPALVPASRLASIQTLNSPERLDEMYIRILRLIAKRIKPERHLARQIFLWLTYQRFSLSAKQLQDIVTPLKIGDSSSRLAMGKRNAPDEFVDFEYTVVMVCASLVELSHTNYRFIHQSVLEFFQNWFASTYDICSDPKTQQLLAIRAEAESELSSSCLSYLLFRAPAQPLSGDMRKKASPPQIKDTFPFLSYASVCWTHHLKRATTRSHELSPSNSKGFANAFQDLLQVMSKFLSNKLVLMAWIESLYTFAHKYEHCDIHGMMQTWAKWAQNPEREAFQEDVVDVPAKLLAFANDLAKINDLWGATLHTGPHQIWLDITGFTGSPFLLQTSATSVKSMAALDFGESFLSSKPLTTISVEATEFDVLGVLSIWPSR